ncbi:hypothetical protein MTR_2g079960 [Medicago truncatula]|uniref:Uncharacterized protein n=1 Tax=Medicago truncatula TaxID=3880 RepID=A0A072VB06_MEDTR|nr:hypothetical protein MTR_2g079960 [Medicago truncatula]
MNLVDKMLRCWSSGCTIVLLSFQCPFSVDKHPKPSNFSEIVVASVFYSFCTPVSSNTHLTYFRFFTSDSNGLQTLKIKKQVEVPNSSTDEFEYEAMFTTFSQIIRLLGLLAELDLAFLVALPHLSIREALDDHAIFLPQVSLQLQYTYVFTN